MKKLTRGKGRLRMMTGDSYRKANAEASVAASEETKRGSGYQETARGGDE